MKRLLISSLLAALILAGCKDSAYTLPTAVAHRGCWLMDGDEFYINENCPQGVTMAARYGYPAVEIDVKYTSDSVMVVMHDDTINRTMRMASDYSPIREPVYVEKASFEELRTKYVLASTDPGLRTPIPTLKEELAACKEYGIIPMLHSEVIESYFLAQSMLGDSWIGFTGNEEALREARKISDCLVLLDPGRVPVENTVERLLSLGGKAGMSTMGYDMLDASYIKTVKDAGFEVQASIFPTPHEVRAVHDGVTIQLSDFYWLPSKHTGREAASWKAKRKMSEGDTEEMVLPEDAFQGMDFIAYTLDLTFSGRVSVDLNGRTYTLASEGPATEHFGLRLYKDIPSVKITANGPSEVKARAKIHIL